MKHKPKIGDYFTIKTIKDDKDYNAKKHLRIITEIFKDKIKYRIVPQSPYHATNIFEYSVAPDSIDLLSRETNPEYYL